MASQSRPNSTRDGVSSSDSTGVTGSKSTDNAEVRASKDIIRSPVDFPGYPQGSFSLTVQDISRVIKHETGFMHTEPSTDVFIHQQLHDWLKMTRDQRMAIMKEPKITVYIGKVPIRNASKRAAMAVSRTLNKYFKAKAVEQRRGYPLFESLICDYTSGEKKNAEGKWFTAADASVWWASQL